MKQYFLGIEFGSTRIKAVLLDEKHAIVKSGDYTWKSSLENGVWTYHMEDVQEGLRTAIQNLGELPGKISAMGVSGMMHGYLAFDKDWNLLAPFRTWQNTMTGEAADKLTEAFGFNIPQRWSAAHLYQAVLNGEPHVKNIAHVTTLAGYVHYLLTGENVLGVGEASGMFPIDSETLTYDAAMLDKFDALMAKYGFDWNIRAVLPEVRTAGQSAGLLTPSGSEYLGGLLPAGDAGTGMTATNAVAPRTGNVSAGTSIFAMVVLEKPLSKLYPEIDMVTTPTGKPVAMVHCNNCTNDMNAWVSLLGETAQLFGAEVSTGELFTKLYQKSLEGETDCSGVLTYNYMAGEGVTHLDGPPDGRPQAREQVHPGQLPALPALRHDGDLEARHGHPCRGTRGDRQPDRPRRPVQDAGRRPEVHGRGLPCAGHVHAVGRRGRPVRHGPARILHGAGERRRDA